MTTINTPGKFEGEDSRVPVLWNDCLDGFSDHDINGSFYITTPGEDHYGVSLYEDMNGFVHATWYATEQDYQTALDRDEQHEAQAELENERAMCVQGLDRFTWKSSRYRHGKDGIGYWDEEKADDVTEMSYGDFTRDKNGEYIMVPYCGGSDYSGDSVTASNHRVFLKDFGKCPGVWNVYGGYGTYAIAVRITDLTQEMIEIINRLESYPVIDEDAMFEMELEQQNEAWENWVRSDFTKALIKAFPSEENTIGNMEDDQLYELFRNAMEKGNIYWENETGNNAWIDVDEIAAHVEL